MRFLPQFLNKIRQYDGKNVQLEIIHINESNHPLGAMGMMHMNQEDIEKINIDIRVFNGSNGIISMFADMKFDFDFENEKLIFRNKNYNYSLIKIFRPDPPMILSGKDMSLWWSYTTEHDAYANAGNSRINPLVNAMINEGDSYPIRDIRVNGISHSM
jgi:hypothetical protein